MTWGTVFDGMDLFTDSFTANAAMVTQAAGADILNYIYIQFMQLITEQNGWLLWVFYGFVSFFPFLILFSWLVLLFEPAIRKLVNVWQR